MGVGHTAWKKSIVWWGPMFFLASKGLMMTIMTFLNEFWLVSQKKTISGLFLKVCCRIVVCSAHIQGLYWIYLSLFCDYIFPYKRMKTITLKLIPRMHFESFLHWRPVLCRIVIKSKFDLLIIGLLTSVSKQRRNRNENLSFVHQV